MINVPQPLTFKEDFELTFLNNRIFGDSPFVAITPEIEDSADYKRLNELVKKKQAYLLFLRQVVLN